MTRERGDKLIRDSSIRSEGRRATCRESADRGKDEPSPNEDTVGEQNYQSQPCDDSRHALATSLQDKKTKDNSEHKGGADGYKDG